MNIPLKTIVKGNDADFIHYKEGNLWYRVTGQHLAETGESETFTFDFPVPVSDTGEGIFPAQIKAITLMRWIRQHLDS
ncbi:MAG: hypothetical protein KGS72_27090 [Cyanobacteria bacterium REEB67]|nr:hypothetical protein [Cyanobacteria bacterium REEB67]